MKAKELPLETVSPIEVHHALAASLARHAAAEAEGVDVGTFGGEVWLVGHVDSDLVRQILTDAAREVPGVTSVHDLLEISTPNTRRTP
jgi:osmotically-inducible protein OsmY